MIVWAGRSTLIRVVGSASTSDHRSSITAWSHSTVSRPPLPALPRKMSAKRLAMTTRKP